MHTIPRLLFQSSTSSFVACLILFAGKATSAQNVVVPAGTPARAQLIKSSSVHSGRELSAKLMDPIYIGEKLAFPEGTLVRGEIVDLSPDRTRRLRGRLNGDFTPFHKSHVRFTTLILPSGQAIPIATTEETGSVAVQLIGSAGSSRTGSYIGRTWTVVKDDVRRSVAVVTGPDKQERLERFAYSQLPYHPEKLYKGVAFSFEFARPVELTEQLMPQTSPVTLSRAVLRAYLKTPIRSSETKVGAPIEAIVAEPYTDAARELTIAQGATLLGTVTQAKPAKWFGRSGTLRFTFRQVRMPQGGEQPVQGTPAAVEAETTQQLTMDAEGGVKSAPKDRFIRPLVLAYLTSYAAEGDGGNSLGGDAVASNGFGLVGRIAGVAGGSPNLAMGIGYYAVALSTYDGFIAKGLDVSFPRNTRLEILLQPAGKRSEEGTGDRKALSDSPAH